MISAMDPRVDMLAARRAVEALRSGVPSAAAVQALGTGQEILERQYRSLLDRLADDGVAGRLVLRGPFGTGKSHLLTLFEHLALAEGFAVSRVVISKETPLNSPPRVLRSAVENLRVPNTVGRGLEEVGVLLLQHMGSKAIDELSRYLIHGRDLDSRFAATWQIFQGGAQSEPLVERILRFWSGEPLTVRELQTYLRDLDISGYRFESIRARELALQCFRFLPRVIQAAGLRGWVVLIDELELIGRYSKLARGQAYAELAGLLGLGSSPCHGMVTVAAVTADFTTEVLEGKGDLDVMAAHLQTRDPAVAALAEKGMSVIRSADILQWPAREVLQRTYETLKILHAGAYGWRPPEVSWPEALTTTPMRTYVRAWINAWDICRLYPSEAGVEMHYEIKDMPSNYQEALALTADASDD
ncbi:MAG: BREX system ATP-binding domain-containing protein [Candidatus Xenobia bacterium]